MKLMMNLLGLIVLLGSAGCVVREHGGAYDGYYRGYGYGYRYDSDHDGLDDVCREAEFEERGRAEFGEGFVFRQWPAVFERSSGYVQPIVMSSIELFRRRLQGVVGSPTFDDEDSIGDGMVGRKERVNG